MAKANTLGFFTMDMVHQVVAMKDLDAAKKIAVDAIDAAKNAKPENARKANAMVYNAKSINSLAIAMSNFMLSHDGNKVI